MKHFHLLPLGLALAIGLLPIVPPEHVHEGTGSDGHHHSVAHRHAQPHLLVSQAGRAVAFDDKDPVITIEPLFGPPVRAAAPLPLVLAVRIVPAPVATTAFSLTDFVEHTIHGPPRGSSNLRGPPFSTFL